LSTGDLAYREELPVPKRRARPAYGEVASPPPAPAESKNETAGPLDRRTEAILALAIVLPVSAAYVGIAYGLYLGTEGIF
jgi:hypothetical protein